MTSIYIFRRDIRLTDNLGFIECYKNSNKILPIFIFTPEQIINNPYFSSNAFQFLLESLEDLNNTLKSKYNSQIHYYYGDNVDVLKEIYHDYPYENVYFNMDYTPYAISRDDNIKKYCEKNNINLKMTEDYLLEKIGTFLKDDNTAYQKYTPFKNKVKKHNILKPNNFKFSSEKMDKINYKFNLKDLNQYYEINENILVHGGRENALKITKNINQYINYQDDRNILNLSTTHLSAYIKFGNISIREVYHIILSTFGIEHGLIDQLIWREFYFYLSYYFPHVLQGKSLKLQYDKIKWKNDEKIFKKWTEGKTGFPLVDAGMREMNKTGYMHNRARLVTAAILIKILNCDWRLGEKYFATKLIDYDPAVNNGNWQWVSSSGADSQPYFRIFSPWKQSVDYDKDCEYIKRWVPELSEVPNKDIHNWYKSCEKYHNKIKYPKPIVDYDIMRKEILNVYKSALY